MYDWLEYTSQSGGGHIVQQSIWGPHPLQQLKHIKAPFQRYFVHTKSYQRVDEHQNIVLINIPTSLGGGGWAKWVIWREVVHDVAACSTVFVLSKQMVQVELSLC